MTVFETDTRQAYGYGIAAIIACGLIALALIVLTILTPVGGLTFVLLLLTLLLIGLGAWLIFRLRAMLRSSYALDRNSIVIRWGELREVVSMSDVQQVIDGLEVANGLRIRRVPLPGWWFGEGQHPQVGKIRFYSTAPLADQVIIVTPEMNYAVSPYDMDAFLESLKTRYEMGPTQTLTSTRLLPPLMESDLWTDHAVQIMIALMLLSMLALLGVALTRYPNLPTQVPLHFNEAGVPDRFGAPRSILTPLLVAVGWLVADLAAGVLALFRRERMAAYLILGGGVAVQLMFLIAMLFISFS
jgi:Ca2+/Na+ antiporter